MISTMPYLAYSATGLSEDRKSPLLIREVIIVIVEEYHTHTKKPIIALIETTLMGV